MENLLNAEYANQVLNFKFSYNQFVQGYYSYAQRIMNEQNQQIGVYRVRLGRSNMVNSDSTLIVSFWLDKKSECNQQLEINSDLFTTKSGVKVAAPLFENLFTSIVENLTNELKNKIINELKH